MPSTVTVGGENITLDILLWRRHGRRGVTAAVLREALELNPGLAALGPVIPLHTIVILPDLPPVAPARSGRVPAVSLFD
jgi:phage tail protein X